MRKNMALTCLVFVLSISLCFCVINQANAYLGGTSLYSSLFGGVQYSGYDPFTGTSTYYSYSPGLLGGLLGGGLYGGGLLGGGLYGG
jgi:hypothetical protein